MKQYINAHVVTPADVEAAHQVMQLASVSLVNEHVALVMALTVRAFRDGHACLVLDEADSWKTSDFTEDWPDHGDLLNAVHEHSEIFGSPDAATHIPQPPFVFDDGKVYITRVFVEEQSIAQFLRANAERIRIVLGGPGTGKTTWVAQTLSELPDNKIPVLALCAPTGKAAQRMREVLDERLRTSGASEQLLNALSHAPSETAHKLLKYAPHRQPKYAYQGEAKMEYTLVIVDEASMMPLAMMQRLVNALPEGGELWLVGDPDQLASVEAGSVLADIARGANNPSSPLHTRVTLLSEQHRFPATSSIAQLADAVRKGDEAAVKSILQSPSSDFEWIDSSKHLDRLDELGKEVIAHAQAVQQAAVQGDAVKALAMKSQLQVLSATRKGRLGIDHWNSTVENALGAGTAQRWYVGRPVMVTRNDQSTQLSNGDVGIVCHSPDGVRGFFGSAADPRNVSLARLPYVETVHALTIHKSQGSEYDHAIVVIPDADSRIVTRELLYTGITRPKKKLTVVGSLDSILHAVKTDIRRATGLADRLT